MNVGAALRERLGEGAPQTIAGGASFAYTAGAILGFLLAFEALTGIALAAFYSPSATDAWASVAYLQDQTGWGGFVRGLHHHGGGAIVIVAGIHLVQTALAGAYKRPREVVWWLGILLLLLVLAWAITGYVLPWDQAGYWANQVEVGIAASTPVVGARIRSLAIGGNDYGNLTLTRFYALHVGLLPALVVVATYAHVKLARRHGTTPMRPGTPAAEEPRFPAQTLRDLVGITIVMVILIAVVATTGGAPLAAPADPSAAYDARPLWYFRWLFELRELAGSAEKLAAMAAPAIVGGFLVALPLLDRGVDRAPRARVVWLGALAGLLSLIAALTVMSFARDSSNPELAERAASAARHGSRARALAKANGIPATGARDVFTTVPMYTARTLWARSCKGCHEDGPPNAKPEEQRKGPRIGAGYLSRAWLTAFLKAPSGDEFYGRTKLGNSEAAMKPVDLPPADLADLVELMYAQTGATDIDAAKVARGKVLFESSCSDCHALEDGVAGTSAPGLAGLGSRDHFAHFIGNPHAAIHLGEQSEMPPFADELTLLQRDALAEYLGWLRDAAPADVSGLAPL